MSLHHYECVAPCLDNVLQRSRFWAASLASVSSMLNDERSSDILRIRVECGCPGCDTKLRPIICSRIHKMPHQSVVILRDWCPCKPAMGSNGRMNVPQKTILGVLWYAECSFNYPANSVAIMTEVKIKTGHLYSTFSPVYTSQKRSE